MNHLTTLSINKTLPSVVFFFIALVLVSPLTLNAQSTINSGEQFIYQMSSSTCVSSASATTCLYDYATTTIESESKSSTGSLLLDVFIVYTIFAFTLFGIAFVINRLL